MASECLEPSSPRWKKSAWAAAPGLDGGFDLTGAPQRPVLQRFSFDSGTSFGGAALVAPLPADHADSNWAANFGAATSDSPARLPHPDEITDLKPLGQVSASFIIAVNAEGLWIVDQHVAHERVLFEQHLDARRAGKSKASAC